jgi:cysteine protease ATG4
MTNPTKTSSHYSHGHMTTDKELPQPENSNHISTAPFRYKVITNSSYLAAEIPLKFGHFVSNLWHQRPQPQCTNETIWLLGSYYHALSANLDSIQLALLDAQRTDMFGPDEPDDDLLWPPDFYEDFNSKVWMTYRHNYPPIRPSNHKTDIGWGCMLRSGQSLLANTLVMNFLSRGK